MIKQHIVSAKNVEAAIDLGLIELGLTREDVDIRIVDSGGMFKKAKVILEYESKEEEIIEKPEIKAATESDKSSLNLTKPKKEFEKVKKSEEKKQFTQTKYQVTESKELEEKITDFLSGLLEKLNVKGEINFNYDDVGLNFKISGDDIGKLIGYRGENLNSIQHILNGLKSREESKIRILFDVENYKQRREKTLVDLGVKMARKAIKNNRSVHLEPMNAYERRIIHTALQEMDEIYTESFGDGSSRHVVIKLK